MVIGLVVHLKVCLSQLAVVLIFVILPCRCLLLLLHQECAFMLVHHLSQDPKLIIRHEYTTRFKKCSIGRWQDLIFIGKTSSQIFSFARIMVRGAPAGTPAILKGLGVRIVVVCLINLIMIFLLPVILFFFLLVVLNRIVRVLLLILLIIPRCHGLRYGSFSCISLAFLCRVRVIR